MSDRIVSVLPDVPAIDRRFDYLVPEHLGDQVRVGTMVRVSLSGRRVGGWVMGAAEPGPAADERRLQPIEKITGVGPDPTTIELCEWAAWRWAGRTATLLRLASPERAVTSVPPLRERPTRARPPGPLDDVVSAALGRGAGVHVVEVGPTSDPADVVGAALSLGQLLVVIPSVVGAERLTRAVRSAGAPVARWPRDWQAAAGGATVVGGRSAVFAPAPALRAVLVIDEHDQMLQSESSPTWHAREVAVERARRAGVPCLLVSPCPSLEALSAQLGDGGGSLWRRVGPGVGESGGGVGDAPELPAPRERVSVAVRRSGWAPLSVIDRRGEDSGRTGLYSSRLVDAVRGTARSGGRVVCILNRTGRARLLACRSCATLAECERCGAAVHLRDDLQLECTRCSTTRPGVCLECGSTALSTLRVGVTRAREELEALTREHVAAVTGRAGGPGSDQGDQDGDARIVIGTEAALHRIDDVDLVAFLDFDQELFAPRYRAAEEALALLVLATRQVGGRSRGGRLVVQTHSPDHEVIEAALRADPAPVARSEAARRRMLRFPPAAAIATVGGEAASAYIDRVGAPAGIDVLGPTDGRWMLRADDHRVLLDHLATVERPPGRLRLQVDPARIR